MFSCQKKSINIIIYSTNCNKFNTWTLDTTNDALNKNLQILKIND